MDDSVEIFSTRNKKIEYGDEKRRKERGGGGEDDDDGDDDGDGDGDDDDDDDDGEGEGEEQRRNQKLEGKIASEVDTSPPVASQVLFGGWPQEVGYQIYREKKKEK